MTEHRIGTQEEWQGEREAVLAEEKELTHRGDEVTAKRQAAMGQVVKKYGFETADGRSRSRICSATARSLSSTTSCSAPTGQPAARAAPRSRTASLRRSHI